MQEGTIIVWCGIIGRWAALKDWFSEYDTYRRATPEEVEHYLTTQRKYQ